MLRGITPPVLATPAHSPGMDVAMAPRMAAGGLVDLKLGHYSKDGIEVVDVGGEIDIYTAPRLRELLIDLAGKNNYQLIVNLEKALEEQRNGEWRYLEFLQVTSWITADMFMREIPGGTRARHRSRPVDLPEHRY